jgi:hypothetical protein
MIHKLGPQLLTMQLRVSREFMVLEWPTTHGHHRDEESQVVMLIASTDDEKSKATARTTKRCMLT